MYFLINNYCIGQKQQLKSHNMKNIYSLHYCVFKNKNNAVKMIISQGNLCNLRY
jgi:hypothetical protein